MPRMALIGEKLGHSLSVPIHEAIFRHLGIRADYHLVEIPKADFVSRVLELMDEVDGFNITIPYKQDIMPLLDGIDGRAQTIGAVNTVVIRREGSARTTCGYNTDVLGLKAMLLHEGIDPKGVPCYCLGTGGASKAVVAAARELGASRVTLVSRTPKDDQISYDRLAGQFEGGVIINSTPSGMWPNVRACPLTDVQLKRILPKCQGVADLIYNPEETCLTAAARAAGVPACTGLYMLIDQAVEAERLWLERDLPADMTERLMREIHL